MMLTMRMPGADSSTLDERKLEDGTLTLGRGPGNDWVLPDPERVLSKLHCRIDRSGDGFVLTDVSTNGVFMAGEMQPIGRGRSRALQGGDLVMMGPYHFEIVIESDAPKDARAAPFSGVPFSGVPHDGQSPIAQTHAPWLEQIPGGEFGPDRHVKPQGWEVPLDPADYAATGVRVDHPLDQGPLSFSQTSEHASAIATVMRLPETQSVLPTNWMDGDPMAEVELAPTPLDPPPALIPESITPRAYPESAEIAIPNEDLLVARAEERRPAAAAPVDMPGSPILAAFLEGAGLTSEALAGVAPEDAARDLGRRVRAAVDGVREILATRAMVKSELRVEQTAIRASDNNAMKFAPDIQRCLDAMVGQPPPGFLPGSVAMQQAMTDIKAHELALVAALNGVFAALTEKLDPEVIAAQARSEGSLNVVPYARKARCWDIFTEHFQAVQGTEAQNTGGSLMAPLAAAYARQLRRNE